VNGLLYQGSYLRQFRYEHCQVKDCDVLRLTDFAAIASALLETRSRLPIDCQVVGSRIRVRVLFLRAIGFERRVALTAA